MHYFLRLLLFALILSGCVPARQSSLVPPTPTLDFSYPTPMLEVTDQPEPTTAPEVEHPPTSTPESGDTTGWIAYITAEGNLSLIHPLSGDRLQVTNDAFPLGAGNASPTISYCCPKWSSDGKLLAFQREVGTPRQDGYQFEFSLWVYEAETGVARPLIENQRVVGYDWQPGTSKIAYGVEVDYNYFANRSGPSPDYAKGIWEIDVMNGAGEELVSPSEGYWLVNPKWSPSSRYLAFEEVTAMEGRGRFAYYDFENQQYSSWRKPVGFFSWSLDNERIAYDELTYHPNGSERIWISQRDGSNELPFSPETDSGYAFMPSFSPQGDTIAYFQEINGPESGQYTLIVQAVEGGGPRILGEFTQVSDLSWSPDGKYVILTSGPFEGREVLLVDPTSKYVKPLARGSQSSWQPASN